MFEPKFTCTFDVPRLGDCSPVALPPGPRPVKQQLSGGSCVEAAQKLDELYHRVSPASPSAGLVLTSSGPSGAPQWVLEAQRARIVQAVVNTGVNEEARKIAAKIFAQAFARAQS